MGAAEQRQEFFNLSAPSTVSLQAEERWWQKEPVLRLDGPKFNFHSVSVLGRHAYSQSTGEAMPKEGALEMGPPPGDWFRSTPGLSERLAKNAAAAKARGGSASAAAASRGPSDGAPTEGSAVGATSIDCLGADV